MSYYPILSAPKCEGVTTVFNFAPNNWEERSKVSRYLNVSCSEGDSWHNICLGEVKYGASLSVTRRALGSFIKSFSFEPTFYLSLGAEPAHRFTDVLPTASTLVTSSPAWRASLSLIAPTGAQTSYQGEIDPFPAPGSLLTFGYFLQPSSSILNFLLFVNLEKSAKQRKGLIELRDARQLPCITKFN